MGTNSFRAENLSKTFNRKLIFTGVNFSLDDYASMTITGRNGSGKSTLLKILIGVLAPTKGTISVAIGGKEIPQKEQFRYTGFVSPYLQMYEEFTAWENLSFYSKIRGIQEDEAYMQFLLERVNLIHAKHQLVKTYSSGMKQRLKYAFALIHKPPILILDEPTANLDSEGKSAVQAIIAEQKTKGITIVATNEPDEIAWCETSMNLDDCKTGKKPS